MRAGGGWTARRAEQRLALVWAAFAAGIWFLNTTWSTWLWEHLPLLSGVMYAVNEIPTKWQWILAFNPMTAVIAGWRWAILGAPEPVWTHTAVGVGVGIALFLTFGAIWATSVADYVAKR